MAHALPVAKLASLVIKTLAKPLSKRIKHEASQYKISSRFLVAIGQTSHNITSRLTIWSAGYRVRSIPPLEEDKALSMGADVVGESFILLVSIGTIIFEANRGWEKDRIKAEKQKEQATQERRELQAQLHTLDLRLQALEQMVLSSQTSILRSVVPTPIGLKWSYKPPPESEIVPILKPSDDDSKIGGEDQAGYPAKIEYGESGKSTSSAATASQSSIATDANHEAASSQKGGQATSSWWRWPPW